jgi:hypothetical protein
MPQGIIAPVLPHAATGPSSPRLLFIPDVQDRSLGLSFASWRDFPQDLCMIDA